MSRKPYTVENMRPRRPVHLYGRTLAPKGRGRTSRMDLTEEEFDGTPCQRLLSLNRLTVVREPVELERASEPEPTLSEEAAAVHSGRAAEILSLQKDAETASEEETPEESEDDGTTPPDPLQDLDKVWTEAELKDLLAADQKVIVESRGLDGGTNAKSRIEAILAAQGDQ